MFLALALRGGFGRCGRGGGAFVVFTMARFHSLLGRFGRSSAARLFDIRGWQAREPSSTRHFLHPFFFPD